MEGQDNIFFNDIFNLDLKLISQVISMDESVRER